MATDVEDRERPRPKPPTRPGGGEIKRPPAPRPRELARPKPATRPGGGETKRPPSHRPRELARPGEPTRVNPAAMLKKVKERRRQRERASRQRVAEATVQIKMARVKERRLARERASRQRVAEATVQIKIARGRLRRERQIAEDVGIAVFQQDMSRYMKERTKERNAAIVAWDKAQATSAQVVDKLTKRRLARGRALGLAVDREVLKLEQGKAGRGKADKAKDIGVAAADMIVPGLWARNWNKMSWKDRAFNIAMDAAFVIPVGGVALRAGVKGGVRVGSKVVRQADAVAAVVKQAGGTSRARAFKVAQKLLRRGLSKGSATDVERAGEKLVKLGRETGIKPLSERGLLYMMRSPAAPAVPDILNALSRRQAKRIAKGPNAAMKGINQLPLYKVMGRRARPGDRPVTPFSQGPTARPHPSGGGTATKTKPGTKAKPKVATRRALRRRAQQAATQRPTTKPKTKPRTKTPIVGPKVITKTATPGEATQSPTPTSRPKAGPAPRPKATPELQPKATPRPHPKRTPRARPATSPRAQPAPGASPAPHLTPAVSPSRRHIGKPAVRVAPAPSPQPAPRAFPKTAPSSQPATRTRSKTATRAVAKTAPHTATGAQPMARPATRAQTKTQTRAQARAQAKTKTKTDTRTRATSRTPVRFSLPKGKGTLPPGQYPGRVTWPQGAVRVTYDLTKGSVVFSKRQKPKGTTPRKGFEVLSTTETPPTPRNLRIGRVEVQIGQRSLTFKRRSL